MFQAWKLYDCYAMSSQFQQVISLFPTRSPPSGSDLLTKMRTLNNRQGCKLLRSKRPVSSECINMYKQQHHVKS